MNTNPEIFFKVDKGMPIIQLMFESRRVDTEAGSVADGLSQDFAIACQQLTTFLSLVFNTRLIDFILSHAASLLALCRL